MNDEHPYAQYVRTLGRGKRSRRSLTGEEARAVFGGLLDGELTDAQAGALLMLLRVKEETPEELAGFIVAARERIRRRHGELPPVDLDWPSYSGKKKHHPWYLLAAKLLASDGVRVFLHDGPPHTPGRRYTREMLEPLQIAEVHSADEAASTLERDGLACFPLESLCPGLERPLMLRRELGLRSPVNSVVRSLNPAAAPLSVQTVFHPAYLELHREAARLLGDPGLLLFKGEGGEVEVRPDADTTLEWATPTRGGKRVWPKALARQAPPGEANADALLSLWREDNDDYGRAAVLETVAVMLLYLERAESPDNARERARELWRKRPAL